MKHYLAQDGQIWAFEADGSQDDLIQEGLRLLSDSELAALRAPSAQQLATLRLEQIDTELDIIDKRRARALSDVTLALAAGLATPQVAIDKLASLEAQAVPLRAERKTLTP